MSANDPAAALAELLARLGNGTADALPASEIGVTEQPGFEYGVEPMLFEFLRSFLLWESSEALATVAMGRLFAGVVDCNEIRIFLPSELSEIIGAEYPRSMERSLRLGSALNDVYEREHDVNLECLGLMNKREARSYLLTLEGVPPFVASRMLLLCLGGHAFPVDERLSTFLAAEGVVKKSDSVETATNRMERLIRSGDAQNAYRAIEAWAQTKPLPKEKRGTKKAGVRRSSTSKD